MKVEMDSPPSGPKAGLRIDLPNFGSVQLTGLLAQNSDAEVYRTDNPGVVVKMLNLDCGKADEISYGPYMDFALELANFEDIMNIEELRAFVPRYYGANIDYQKKYAYIAMEYLEGQDLKSWCDESCAQGYPDEWLEEFREAIYDALSIVKRFHKHGIILVDFKSEDILRLKDKRIKFVDLGSMFTPRQFRERDKYVYSATPDHSELVIDASNVQTGVALTEATDIFSAGVSLFEMAAGTSRLVIDSQTADDILGTPEVYLFRDSQIRDVWRSCPNLKDALPLLEMQLKDRYILFSEVWHLLKGYLGVKYAGWEELPASQQEQLLLTTGTTFIMEQLPTHLQWLAGFVAKATILRSMRPKTVAALMKLLEKPAPEEARADLREHNSFIQYWRDLGHDIEFVDPLNYWEVRLHHRTWHWALAASVACVQAAEDARFIFLKQCDADSQGHKYFQVADDLEADDYQGGKLTLWNLDQDHFAWLGV